MAVPGTLSLLLSVLLGLFYFVVLPRPASHFRAILKTLPVMLLAGHAWFTQSEGLLVVALALSALGDAFLAYKGERAFMAGLVSFLLAHIAYGALFVSLSEFPGTFAETWRVIAAVISIAFIVLFVGSLRGPAGKLAPAVFVYGLAILAMALLSLAVPSAAVFVGAALFMSSDAVLSIQTFVMGPSNRWSGIASYYVWGSYFAAQCILATTLSGGPTGL